jgi:hypothetical protein
MPVEDTTTGRGYPKPHPTNPLAFDVQRLRDALDQIDADVDAGVPEPTIESDPTGITGAGVVSNVVSISQSNYDAIVTPDATTLYVVTD